VYSGVLCVFRGSKCTEELVYSGVLLVYSWVLLVYSWVLFLYSWVLFVYSGGLDQGLVYSLFSGSKRIQGLVQSGVLSVFKD